MSYTKQEFVSGQILKAEHLNNMEDGIGQLSEEIVKLDDLKIGLGLERAYTLYNNVDGEIPSTNFANTKRWFFNHVFKKGCTIIDIEFENLRVSEQTITFEIWTKSGDTLTKVKTIEQTVTSQNVYKTNINYTGTDDFMLAFIQTLGTICYDSSDGDYMIVSDDALATTSTLSYESLWHYNGLKPAVKINVNQITHDNVILIGEGQKYTQIQEALEAIADDSAANPYTLILMPSSKPYERFSMIRDLGDTYPWSDIAPRWISIIGLNKANTIIQSNTGEYESPAAEILTNGIIKNVTFQLTNAAALVTPNKGGYAVHIDCRTKDDIGYDLIIEDCAFESATGPAIGIGTHENVQLTFRRCHFTSTASASYIPNENYMNLHTYGCAFVHTSVLADSINQRITFEDCIGMCAEGNKSLWIAAAGEYSPDTADFEYTLIRNVFWNRTANSSAYLLGESLSGNSMNFGNNI